MTEEEKEEALNIIISSLKVSEYEGVIQPEDLHKAKQYLESLLGRVLEKLHES